MKIRRYISVLIIVALITSIAGNLRASGDEDPHRVSFTAAKDQKFSSGKIPVPAPFLNPENGSIAWAHNAWTYEVYHLDIETPTTYTVLDTVDFQTFAGDFVPGDSQHLWVIQYPENILRKINITTGESSVVTDLPVPLADGIWTSLAVDKSTGMFYGIATDGVQSVLYSVDEASGGTEELFGLGLQAAISSTYDSAGNLYLFDIETDSTYVANISAATVTGLGPAGFDGNYAHGMGYDPVGDEVYLAAYHNTQGPQLRILNRITGETTLLASLPGETGAFGFPSEATAPQASAGPDVTICGDQTFATQDAFASNYISLEWSTNGDGTFENPDQLIAVYHPGPQDIVSGAAELCLAATGFDGTNTSTDCLTLTLTALPVSDAGPDATVIFGDSFTVTEATAQNFNALLWSTTGDGTFDDPAELLPVYTPGPADINAGQAELCLTAQPVDPCEMNVVSCMILTIDQIPSGVDFGDAPEITGIPNTYPTTLAQSGAAHSIDPTVFLGQKIDGEPDGQPSPDATGDDTDLFYPSFGDDEDGVEMPSAIYQGTQVNVTIAASVDGYLDAWIDFNRDNTWFSPNEHILQMVPIVSGSNQLSFIVPPIATPGQSYIRFRFRDYAQPLEPGGFAYNGEVEDYQLEIRESQAEEMDFGDAPGIGGNPYPTLFSQDGARHKLMDGIHLGSSVDAEPDGQPVSGALGDDQDIYYPAQGDDEDGVSFPETIQAGSEIEIEVLASVDGFLDAWFDFNRDGQWTGAEHVFNTFALTAGANQLQVSIPAGAAMGTSYTRFRFRDYDAPLLPSGMAENGEVEDYVIQITGEPAGQFDYGDAPGSIGSYLYPTLNNMNGARHRIVAGIWLGNTVDAEPDGQPSPAAQGDDLDIYYQSDGDDEDGVVFQNTPAPGTTASITVTASVDGYLEAWIDYDRDGQWDDDTEHVLGSEPLSAGANNLTIPVPGDAEPGITFARFRFSDYDAQPGPGGTLENGEVEDYMVLIQEETQQGYDFGDAPGNLYPVTLADDGARHLAAGNVFLGSLRDTEQDGFGSNDALGDDNNNLDDEDGIQFPNMLAAGSSGQLQVQASTSGYLNAWADFGQDGSWNDAGDHILNDVTLNAGINTIEFAIPENAGTGACFMRFRFSTQPGVDFTGEAPDGEVEDYRTMIYPDWNVTPSSIVHIIMIPTNLPALTTGDLLGVFYMDNDMMKPAGNIVYNPGQPGQLAAFGDNPATPDVKEGFAAGEPFNWKMFDAESGEVIDVTADYDPQFPNHDGTFQPGGLSAVISIQPNVQPCPMPPEWEFIVTGKVHSINIPAGINPAILGEPLTSGDWIGAFYKNEEGAATCGGAMQWTEGSGVVMNIYGDDPFTGAKDGFADGEHIDWKIFDCNTGETWDARAGYNPDLPCKGQFADFCLSELSLLQGMYFSYYMLSEGWNSISSYLVPYNPDVENMFSGYTDQLIIIKNLESLYWPYAGVNTIGNWDNYSGYAVKMEAATEFRIGGESFAEHEITLEAGWHYLPVLSDCPVNSSEVLEPVADKITIVQDLIGTKVWWPDQNVFTLETLEPGRAYKIRLTEEVTLVFPDCEGNSMMKTFLLENSSDELMNRTPYSHTVAFPGNIIQKLNGSPSISAVDEEGNLFGLLRPTSHTQNAAMVVYGDDPLTPQKEGFAEGEMMRFQLLNAGKEYSTTLDVEFDNIYGFGGRFAENGLSVVKSLAEVKDIASLMPSEIMVYPNPSTGIIFIRKIDQQLEIELFDTYGNLLQDVPVSANGRINLSDWPAGIYFIRIKTGSSASYRKLILK